MKKRSVFLTGILAAGLLVGGVLSSCDDIGTIIDPGGGTTSETETYTIAFAETNGVSATLSKTEAEAGDEIEITIESTPDGYEVASITADVDGVNITASSATLYTFYMPESNVNLTINISEIIEDSYTLKIIDNAGAGISYVMADWTELSADSETGLYTIETYSTVMVRLETSGNYTFDLNGTDISSRYDSDYSYVQFSMPTQDSVLTINASTETTYTVSVSYDASAVEVGLYSLVDGEPNTTSDLVGRSVAAGTELYLYVYVNSGYEITSVTADNVTLEEDNGGYTFTMPSAAVTITISTTEVTVEETTGKIEWDLADGVTKTLYTSEVLESTELRPSDYATGQTEFDIGTKLAFTVSLSSTYSSIYAIEKVEINGTAVTATKYTYTYSATYFGETTEDLELYVFDVQKGTNAITVTTSTKTYSLTIDADTENGGSYTLTYNGGDNAGQTVTDLDNIAYGTSLRIVFTNSNAGATLTSVTRSYQYISWTELTGTENGYTFTMPSRDLTLTATWTLENLLYINTVNKPSSVTTYVQLNDTSVDENAAGTLDGVAYYAIGTGNKVLVEFYDSSASLGNYTITIESSVEGLEIVTAYESNGWNDYTFTMPESDVTLTVTFTENTASGDDTQVEFQNSYIYVTNTGDVPTLTTNSFYIYTSTELKADGVIGNYYYFSNVSVSYVYFGIYDSSIDLSTYNLTVTCVNQNGDTVNLSGPDTPYGGLAREWGFSMPTYAIITINWESTGSGDTGASTETYPLYLMEASGYQISGIDAYLLIGGWDGTQSNVTNQWDTYFWSSVPAGETIILCIETTYSGVVVGNEQGVEVTTIGQEEGCYYYSFTMPSEALYMLISWVA